MSDDVQKLILTEMQNIRKEARADNRDLHTKIDKNYKGLNEKIHAMDQKVLGNKLKLGTMLSVLTIFWTGLVNYFSKKL